MKYYRYNLFYCKFTTIALFSQYTSANNWFKSGYNALHLTHMKLFELPWKVPVPLFPLIFSMALAVLEAMDTPVFDF